MNRLELNKILTKLRGNDPGFVTLDLNKKGVSNEDLREICEALESNSNVTSINLKSNTIDSAGLKILTRFLLLNRTVTSINLDWSRIGEQPEFENFVRALGSNRTLTSISCRYNFVSPEGAQILALALQENTSLTHIDLISNNLGPEGAQSFTTLLESNCTIKSINLQDNDIGIDGMKSIARMLQTNTTLTSISLNENNISDEEVAILADINSSLKVNKYGPRAAYNSELQALMLALSVDPVLPNELIVAIISDLKLSVQGFTMDNLATFAEFYLPFKSIEGEAECLIQWREKLAKIENLRSSETIAAEVVASSEADADLPALQEYAA